MNSSIILLCSIYFIESEDRPMNTILQYLPPDAAREAAAYMDEAREIRLMSTGVAAVATEKELIRLPVEITPAQLRNTLNYICRGAVYSAQSSLREGFVTLEGGHRVGVCGHLTTGTGGAAMVEPSALCFRVARQIIGAAEPLERYLGGNILIISPPGCGKTTMLRDAARILGDFLPVCIIDERSELAAVKNGVPQMDVGKFTCVLDGVKKSEGMLMALRSMAPRVIVTDEIGSDEDIDAIYRAVNSGVAVMTTVHGQNAGDVRRRTRLGGMLDRRLFSCVVTLSGVGRIAEVNNYA